MTVRPSIGRALDWSALAILKIRAREVAEGVFAGSHRSARRGAGVEFGGFREYVRGDDLRWLDRRSLLRHERLVIRQFETETDRALCLVVDASASMAFRGPTADFPKVAYASILAAALARVALSGGDPVSLSFIGAESFGAPVPRAASSEQFDRVVASLDAVRPGGDTYVDRAMLSRALDAVAHTTRRGAVVVVFSDLLDAAEGAAERVAALALGGRVLVVVQVLDPAEMDLPYRGTVRLRALEGTAEVETDADAARAGYRARLGEITGSWERAVVRRGGRFLRASTADNPLQVVRTLLDRLQ
ncbi:MAG: DUF58 domain-containing protein [Polyangiaceae bacterium]